MQDVAYEIRVNNGVTVIHEGVSKTVPLDLGYWWPDHVLTTTELQASMDMPLKICEALPQQVDQQHGLLFGYSWTHWKVGTRALGHFWTPRYLGRFCVLSSCSCKLFS